jgi:hypothetical protein
MTSQNTRPSIRGIVERFGDRRPFSRKWKFTRVRLKPVSSI